ncbi:hypothetical protein [Delftia lacustris]|uniref:hypothetical protein n=1 Tax=Delftia lacustris TaxID=558537 RepID=UPI001FCBE0B4|nr:hypothetical protein [Delftia lacustris]BDE70881.1 hypothetical protein HQS1_20050 [Delftia lacustris]
MNWDAKKRKAQSNVRPVRQQGKDQRRPDQLRRLRFFNRSNTVNKMKQRWEEQFRMFRFDHHTHRAPLLAAVGYTSQRCDRLATRARLLSGHGAHEPIRRADIVKDTTSKAGHIRLCAA